MHRLIRTVLFAAATCAAAMACGQTRTDAAPPARFEPPPQAASAPLPRTDETNAQRAKTQPGNNAPFWRGVHDSGTRPGTVNLPGAEKGVLVQPFVQYPGSRYTNAGEAWRQVRNRWVIPYGGALLLIALGALALLYYARGPLGQAENTGVRRIERFTYFERAAHWANAIAFSVLALSGIVMAFGKFIVLPLTGHVLHGWLSYALKTLHNFFGPLFVVSLIIIFVTFVRDNVPRKGDLRWIAQGGGAFGGREVPSHRFNGGEKVVFWLGVFVLGAVMAASGLVLDKLVPGLAYWRSDMQIAHMVHSVAAMLTMVVFAAHIYLGTIGVRGAYRAMRDGYVDDEWAREHHALWYEDIEAGRIPAQRTSSSAHGGPAVQQP
jgi:formate dehydrogenase subunit gamma